MCVEDQKKSDLKYVVQIHTQTLYSTQQEGGIRKHIKAVETNDKQVSVISHQEGKQELSRAKPSIPEHVFHLLSLKSLPEHSALIILNQQVSLDSSENGFAA